MGDIVWVNGPYAFEYYNSINIFRQSLVSFLGTGERVEADDGYIEDAPHHIKCPISCTNPVDTRVMQERMRSRLETVNRRFSVGGY